MAWAALAAACGFLVWRKISMTVPNWLMKLSGATAPWTREPTIRLDLQSFMADWP